MGAPAKKTNKRGKAENLTNAGKGRPPGVKNKLTTSVKEAILEAFNRAGGADYLVGVAKDDPRTFCTLVGKVIPTEIVGSVNLTLESIVANSFKKDEPDGE